MNAPTIRTLYCCPDCKSPRVETLDWVTVNGGVLVGGDAGTDYWCPDCETHPSRLEALAVAGPQP